MTPGKGGGLSASELIGLVPAGGRATRIAPLPCSKEVFPVGFRSPSQVDGIRPKVAIHYLLERMQIAGVSKAFIVLRPGKWDIPAYLNDGKLVDMHLAYLMMDLPFGVPFTLDQAFPFIPDSLVIFGFPDILFEPVDAFSQLLAQQANSGADLVLGLFPARQPQKMDMVSVDEKGDILDLQIKPSLTNLTHTWIIAVWTPAFTHFMHDYVASRNRQEAEDDPEMFLGHVIQAALTSRLKIDKVLFDEGHYLDIGTPEDLAQAVRNDP